MATKSRKSIPAFNRRKNHAPFGQQLDRITRMSIRDSAHYVKLLLQKREPFSVKKHLHPGNLIFTSYSAKDKTQIWDKKPMFLVLGVSRGHTLGLNFHWLPVPMRVWLLRYILRLNGRRKNIAGVFDFDYRRLKPVLKSLGYAPCIRCYINRRFGKQLVNIPHDQFAACAVLDTAVFSHGRSAESIYKEIIKKSKGKK